MSDTSMTQRYPAIDVHAHLLIPSVQAGVGQRAPHQMKAAQDLDLLRNGAESQEVSGQMVQSRWGLLTDVEARLADMDRTGVHTQWVSTSPNHFYPWADQELATWVYQQVHQAIAEHVAQAPDRLKGLGVIPLQHPELAVAALDDAVGHHGFLGVEISSFAQDVELSDPRLEPFWARAEELGAIIFLHPFGCSLDERLDKYYLSNSVGQPVENAVALSHLIVSGVLDRYPRLKFIAAHGGGYLPGSIGRADHGWQVRPEARTCLKTPSSYLSQLYFDTVIHSDTELRHLIELVGASQVVLGSDYPFDMGLVDPVEQIHRSLSSWDATEEQITAVLYGNAQALAEGSVLKVPHR